MDGKFPKLLFGKCPDIKLKIFSFVATKTDKKMSIKAVSPCSSLSGPAPDEEVSSYTTLSLNVI